ncbi:MAG TPA: hypothetical protein VIY48_03890 [Candidatus Paceibacterota bacterium]
MKPQVIKVIAEVTKPTPGVIRRVGAALRPSLPVPTKQVRPSSAKTAGASEDRRTDIPDLPTALKTASTQKTAWAYDQTTKLYTSNDPMVKFACPGCGHEQDHLGFTKCGGCDRTWNSWPVRVATSGKTSATAYVLMAREIKMRGDQFKMAAAGNVKISADDDSDDDDDKSKKDDDDQKSDKTSSVKTANPEEPPMGTMQPTPGTMPGDNSGAMGSPVPAAAPSDMDNDSDLAGGVTEGSPIDQIQDALQDAIVALKDVQTLSINPQLTAMGSVRIEKVAKLQDSMDRFWGLHKQMNYVAGMLAKEANDAINAMDPRISGEAEFVKGYTAASNNEPLPAKTGRAYLEGYVAFHKQADAYSDGANYGQLFEPGSDDESTGSKNDGSFLDDGGPTDANEIRGDAGPFDASQPASKDFARETDRRNNMGGADRGQGQSGSIQPTGARRAPRARG